MFKTDSNLRRTFQCDFFEPFEPSFELFEPLKPSCTS